MTTTSTTAGTDSRTRSVSSQKESQQGTRQEPPPPRKSAPKSSHKKTSLRAQKKARARQVILASAQNLIRREGYTNTKMRDIAVAANMSYQTLYNYFPTKGLILQELLTGNLIKLHRATKVTLESDGSLTEKLRELAKAYIDAIAPDERELWKEVCAELLKVTSHHSCLLDLIDQHALLKLNNTLQAGQTNGELDPQLEAAVLAEVVFSLLDATLMRYLVNQSLSRASMLSALSAQLRLSVTPHLR